MLLCSDGRVFSDVVGIADETVTAYRDALSTMLETSRCRSLATFQLEEHFADLSFEAMRARMMERYGEPLEGLRASVARGGKDETASPRDREYHRLYCAMTRFLLEDAAAPGQARSRTALQKECRARAYELIRRSQAWGDLIEERFPDAVRLSIHPQACGSAKLGIRLLEPDQWQTPWHGVAVDLGGRFVLMKRAQAEARGAALVMSDGRPSHFVCTGSSGSGVPGDHHDGF